MKSFRSAATQGKATAVGTVRQRLRRRNTNMTRTIWQDVYRSDIRRRGLELQLFNAYPTKYARSQGAASAVFLCLSGP